MEQAEFLLQERKTAGGNKGILPAEWRQKAKITPMRKRLSDITNLCTNVFEERFVSGVEGNGNEESQMIVKVYIAKLLKENNALIGAMAERKKVIEMNNAELKNLQLMLAKTSQQNWQLAQSHSNMLAELNLAKDRLRSAEHELVCSSAALRVRTLELEELKKFNKLNKLQQKISAKEGCSEPVETVADASFVSSSVTCPPDRKRTQRSPSISQLSSAGQGTTKEKDEKQRKKSPRTNSINMQVETSEPREDLSEIEVAKFPMRSGDRTQPKHEESSPTVQKSYTSKIEVKEEPSDSSPHQTKGTRRTSLGRPMRKAAEKVISYKELSVKVKLRRPE